MIFKFFLLIYVRENGVSQNLSQGIGVVDGRNTFSCRVLPGVGVAIHRGGCLAVSRNGRGDVGIMGQFVDVGDDGVAEGVARHALQTHLFEDMAKHVEAVGKRYGLKLDKEK